MPKDLLEGAAKKREPRDLLRQVTNDGKTLSNAPLAVQGLGTFTEGLAGLPGVPLDLMIAGGNFLRRQFDMPEFQPNETTKQFTSEGVSDRVMSALNMPKIAAPRDEGERLVQKAGSFLGGSAPFGPAALAPTATAYGVSELGRLADQAGITGGYGEPGGALLGGVGHGLVRGQVTPGADVAPTVAALRAAKNAAYQAAEREGVIFTPEFLKRLNDKVKEFASSRAYTPENEPGIAGGLRVLEQSAASGDPATLTHIDKLRKTFGNAGGDFTKPSQQSLSAEIKKIFDDMTDPDNLVNGDVLAGDMAAAAKHLKSARNLNQRMRLAETIDEAKYQAENQAPTSGVGGNLENTMRQKIKAILNSPKRRASFSPQERQLMERIVRGSSTQNTLRMVGGFAPSKGFLPAALMAHLGFNAAGAVIPAAVTAPLALAYVGVTQGAKSLAENLTKRNIARLNSTVRLRGTPAPTAAEKINAAWLEAQRRARLAGQSTLPVLPGVVEQER